MRISLKASDGKLGSEGELMSKGEFRDILVHVEVSKSDDPPKFIYSHSFQYIVPSATYLSDKQRYGEIIVYTDKDAASSDVDGVHYAFGLKRCRDKKCRDKKCCQKYCRSCKEESKDGCPIMLGKVDQLVVADVFHTMPRPDELDIFGKALFKALFSGEAGRLLQEAKPMDESGRIFLQLNNHEDLDAIPWEYAKDQEMFLVHQREFSRIHAFPQDSPQKRSLQTKRPQVLPQKRPLRIVAIVPDPIIPLDDPDAYLSNLHLSDQWQKFIDGHYASSKKVLLERVFPPTVDRMDGLLLNEPETATVLHFMGHCGQKDGERALIFEHGETGKQEYVNAMRPIVPKHLWIAFLSACNTREVARILLERGVPYTIGSHCDIPDNLARKFESKFYQLLAGGLTTGMAMWRARVSLQADTSYTDSNRKLFHFSGAMILYSSTFLKEDVAIESMKGNPDVDLHMPLNNLQFFPSIPTFYGRQKELVELNTILRDMANRNRQTCAVHTIKGIGGQGKTALAMEVVRRTAHLFPGGIFAWQFSNAEKISASAYFRRLVQVFSKNIQNMPSNDDLNKLGSTIFDHFVAEASCLLILDQADILKRAEDRGDVEALKLSEWLREVTSKSNVAVKILATSQELLEWPKEEVTELGSFNTPSDIDDGIELFARSLSTDARRRMNDDGKKGENKEFIRGLVERVDGHPSSLILLSRVASRKKYSEEKLEAIVNNHYRIMLAEEDSAKKSLKKHFEAMIDALLQEERLFLYMCTLFTGPITAGVLAFVSYFIDYGEETKERIDSDFETITKNLVELSSRELLSTVGQKTNTNDERQRFFLSSKGNQEYKIHFGLREGVRQHNTNLKLRLSLPIPGSFHESFVIGVPSEYGISKVLEWQLSNIQDSSEKEENKRAFGIQYHHIDSNSDDLSQPYIESNDDDTSQLSKKQQTSFRRLVVFTWEASEPLLDTDDDRTLRVINTCKDRILRVIKETKWPFILCLKHADNVLPKKAVSQLKMAVDILQKSLERTHKLIMTELPSGYINGAFANSDTTPATQNPSGKIDNKLAKKALDVDYDNVYAYGEFVGRQAELKKLDKLLKNKKIRYITILGFGGMGKTALALQAVKNFNSGKVVVLSLARNPTAASVISKIARVLHINTTVVNTEMPRIVWKKLASDETIVFFLDNMEDIKHAADKDNQDAKELIKFFRDLPDNVKILATSRVQLNWPTGETISLEGLQSHEGKRVFEHWTFDRSKEVDPESATAISVLANGHPLSIRLLGSTFNNSSEPVDQLIKNIRKKLPQAQDDYNDRYNSVDTCIQYSFDELESNLKQFILQLRLFEIPFTATLTERALDPDIISPLKSPADSLQKLRQQSWLNNLKYNTKLGNWCPKFMEKDTKFYTLHPRLRDFLENQSESIGSSKIILSGPSILPSDNSGKAERPKAALSIDSEMEFYTALCYGVGFGVVNNLQRQIQSCRKAATKGHLEAQLSLAACYEVGAGGVAEDQEEAFHWYLEAAKSDDKAAQEKVEFRYLKGLGVIKDVLKANYWRKRSLVNKAEPLQIKFDLTVPLLHRAVQCGQVSIVLSLMDQQSANVNMKDRHGRTPLHEATEKRDIKLSILLVVEFHANVNAKDKNGWAPLHVAAHGGDIETVRLLVDELGADADVQDSEARTPLHMAMASKHNNVVNFLSKTLPKVLNLEGNNIGDDGFCALGLALQQSRTLNVLSLNGSNIRTKGASALAESLKHNTALTELNISLRDIGVDGAIALRKSLQQNELALQETGYSAEETRPVRNILIWF